MSSKKHLIKPEPTLEQLAEEIRELRFTAANAIAGIGEKLIIAKAKLKRGEWMSWLEANYQWTVRTADRFMRVAEAFKESKLDTGVQLGDLSIDAGALYYLSGKNVSEEARQEAITEAQKGTRVTVAVAKTLHTKPMRVSVTTVAAQPDTKSMLEAAAEPEDPEPQLELNEPEPLNVLQTLVECRGLICQLRVRMLERELLQLDTNSRTQLKAQLQAISEKVRELAMCLNDYEQKHQLVH